MTVAQLSAFVGGNLIDGSGRDPIEDSVILIKGSVIAEVGSRATVPIPPDYQIVDISGKTVMPGMIESHTHLGTTTVNMMERLNTHKTVRTFLTAKMARKVLNAGFTTVRDAAGLDVGFRVAVEMKLIEGPRLIVSGPLRQTGGHFDKYYASGVEVSSGDWPLSDGVPAVQKEARQLLRQGFDFLKVCTTGGIVSPTDQPTDTIWTRAELTAIVHEANARSKAVMAHAQGTQGIKNAVAAGVWSIEHGSMLDDEAIEMMLEAGTYLVPTLFPFEYFTNHGQEIGLPQYAIAKLARFGEGKMENFQRAAKAGIKMATGSDAIHKNMHGRNARELTLMVKFGYSPMQAIVAATKTSAEVCRIDDRVGILEPGKLADVLVWDGDPLVDISILEDQTRLLLVMKEGDVYVNKLKKQGAR